MFIKKTSKIKSSIRNIEAYLQSVGYKKQDKRYSGAPVVPEDKVYHLLYEEHKDMDESTFYINVGTGKDRYIIKVYIIFYTNPRENIWGINEYKITRYYNDSDNLSYFTDNNPDDLSYLINDLRSALSMKEKEWERIDE